LIDMIDAIELIGDEIAGMTHPRHCEPASCECVHSHDAGVAIQLLSLLCDKKLDCFAALTMTSAGLE